MGSTIESKWYPIGACPDLVIVAVDDDVNVAFLETLGVSDVDIVAGARLDEGEVLEGE